MLLAFSFFQVHFRKIDFSSIIFECRMLLYCIVLRMSYNIHKYKYMYVLSNWHAQVHPQKQEAVFKKLDSSDCGNSCFHTDRIHTYFLYLGWGVSLICFFCVFFSVLFSSFTARLQGSQSLSRDTGLGSTTGDSPVPGLEVTRTPTELTSGCISTHSKMKIVKIWKQHHYPKKICFPCPE